MSIIGYLNVVNCGKGSRCFFIAKEDIANAVCVENGENVKVYTEEKVIESKIGKKEETWFIVNYEHLDIHGLEVEIQI